MSGTWNPKGERELEPAGRGGQRRDLATAEAVENDDPRACGRDSDAGFGREDVALVTRDAVGEGCALGEGADALAAAARGLCCLRCEQREERQHRDEEPH